LGSSRSLGRRSVVLGVADESGECQEESEFNHSPIVVPSRPERNGPGPRHRHWETSAETAQGAPQFAYWPPVSVGFRAAAGVIFFAAFDGATFLIAAFLATGHYAFAASALFNAHRFFVAAIIAFLPAAESFRLGLCAASGAGGSAAFLDAAQRFRCASAIRARLAALILLRLRFCGSGATAGLAGPPESVSRSSAI